ncbi:MAG: ubiquinol-cytochrome c reductase iron-sulfur subunit N-terminal domain-containing protein, partial [Alphaproteobacteria bacterium]
MSAHTHPDEGPDDETRRDFMALLAGAFGALGAAIA